MKVEVVIARQALSAKAPLTKGSSFGGNHCINNGPTVGNKQMKDIPYTARSARRRGKLSVAIKLSSGTDPITPPKKTSIFGPILPISILIGTANMM
jgi:hypothetical protein